MGAPVEALLAQVTRTAQRRQELTAALDAANADYHRAVLGVAGLVKPQEIADAAKLSRAAIHRILNQAADKGIEHHPVGNG